MLDTETIKSISTFVEITMQVEDRLRAKYDREVERLTEELDMVRDERDALTGECYEYEKRTGNLEAQVEDLTGQKERQAQTIKELTDMRDRQAKQNAEALLERQEMPPIGDKELQKKLDKAMDHIRRQGEEIDKLRAGAADPRWVPLKEKQPERGVDVLTCSMLGMVYIAHTDGTGWNDQIGMISTPVAWMPMPKAYTGGEE